MSHSRTKLPAAAERPAELASLVAQLEPMLQRLRLTGMCDQLDNLLEEAARHQMTLREALAWLCAAEVSRKDQSRFEMAMRMARFPCVRTLEGFEFEAQPSIDPGVIRELATCRWIANGDNLVLLGPPGVGKTHLEVALGREAIRLGHSVLFCTAAELIANLTRAQQQGEVARALSTYGKPRLLIIDELGYLPLEHQAAYLLFQLIFRRYEQGSVLISSNRAVTEWGEVFGDQVVATAILDRLLHHSQVLTIRGDSYRLREKRRSGLMASPGQPSHSCSSTHHNHQPMDPTNPSGAEHHSQPAPLPMAETNGKAPPSSEDLFLSAVRTFCVSVDNPH